MGKIDIKREKSLRFARFGGLSSVNQRGYKAVTDDFHGPPASRGFYCFVWPYYEMFLLGATETSDPWTPGAKFKYVRDNKGNIVDDKHADFQILGEKNKYWTKTAKAWADHQKTLPEYPDDDNEYKAYSEKRDAMNKAWEDAHPNAPKYVLVVKPHPKIFTYNGNIWSHLGAHVKDHQILARHGDWVKSSMEDYRAALEREMHVVRKAMYKDSIEYKWNMGPSGRNPFRYYSKDHLECFIEKL